MAQDPLHLLCVEPRFPGRLGHVADWLVRKRGYRCQFYCHVTDPPEYWPAAVGHGLELVHFNVGGVAREPAVPWRRHLERSLCYAYGCWEVLHARRPLPFDVVLGRSAGLGSTLYVPVFQPGIPIVNLFDYYLHARRHDLADEAGPAMPVEYHHWRRAANGSDLVDLENGVVPWTPTTWQRDLFPPEYRDDFVVLHDGIDTRRFQRRRERPQALAGRALPPDCRIVTFVARSCDRLRGFDRFVALAERLLQARDDVLCIAVGNLTVQRSLDVEFYNRNYRDHLFHLRGGLDPDRFWCLGEVPPAIVAEVLTASDLHVAPSRVYPVSRSVLEAQAAGCVVLGADTAPLREFLVPERTGLLLPADDLEAWVATALRILDAPGNYRELGDAGAQMVRQHHAQDITLPRLAALLDHLVDKGI